jgi:hypothetical protein
MIKQDIVGNNTEVQGYVWGMYIQVQDESTMGIWYFSETSSSMICIYQEVNPTSKNVRSIPK